LTKMVGEILLRAQLEIVVCVPTTPPCS
jgi:hypothetical protein